MPTLEPHTPVDSIVEGAVVLTLDTERRVYEPGAVAVEDGAVVAVGPATEVHAQFLARQVIGGDDYIVMPGLVDGHVHITAEHLARSVLPPSEIRGWTEKWALPLYGALRAADEHLGASLACIEMIRNGTTTFGEGGSVLALDAVARAVSEIGLRGQLGLWTWERGPDAKVCVNRSPEAMIAATQHALEEYHGRANGRISITVACVNPVDCSTELLVALKQLADQAQVTFTYHHAGSLASAERARRRFGSVPLRAFRDIGILDHNVRVAHMVHVAPEELTYLRGTDTCVVHCPQTCLRLGYGAAREGLFPEMLQRGITVGLGTDGVTTSDNQDLFKAMHSFAGLFCDARSGDVSFTSETVVEMATLHNAKALMLESSVGSLMPGMRADMILIKRRTPEFTPLLNLANALVYGSDGRNVDTVMIDGRVVMEDRRLLTVDEEAIYNEVASVSTLLLKRAGIDVRASWNTIRNGAE